MRNTRLLIHKVNWQVNEDSIIVSMFGHFFQQKETSTIIFKNKKEVISR